MSDLRIKKGDIFDVYRDGQPTRRCIATHDSKHSVETNIEYLDGDFVYCRPIDDFRVPFSSPALLDNEVEEVICNIDDLEEIAKKAWKYDEDC